MNIDFKRIGIIVVATCAIVGLAYTGYQTQVNTERVVAIQKQLSDTQADGQNSLLAICASINKKLDTLQTTQRSDIEKLDNKIDLAPQIEKIKKFKLQEKLKQLNVFITNTSVLATGSGVTIKYKGEFYVLSAGHLVEQMTDKLELSENDVKICDLEIVKWEYTPEDNTPNSKDLALFRPVQKDIVPRVYIEIEEVNLVNGIQLLVVGNPLGIEDVISDARVVAHRGNYDYFIGTSYFGNSGGGVYNTDGKLVGIVSHLIPMQPNPAIPPYMVHGMVSLDTIFKFLKGV